MERKPDPEEVAALVDLLRVALDRVVAARRAQGWALLAALAAGWAVGRCAEG